MITRRKEIGRFPAEFLTGNDTTFSTPIQRSVNLGKIIMPRSKNSQSQRRKAQRPVRKPGGVKPVGIKLVIDHSEGEAVVHVLPNALRLAFQLLDMVPDMVCYTPATEYHGVCTDIEMMDATSDIRQAIIENNFATAEHFIVCNGDDGGVYIYLLPGAFGPTIGDNDMEIMKLALQGRILPIFIVYKRTDFQTKHDTMVDKPQRVWPEEMDGELRFVGSQGRRFIGATLNATLAETGKGLEKVE